MPALLTDVFGAVTTDSEPTIIGNKITGLRIFRAGSFSDSTGTRQRYTRNDLSKMAENFRLLRDKGILPHVPVREDHTRSIGSVVGYFLDVRAEGNFLVADIELTEPAAVQRYSNKTYRARSAEVGEYTDNDENTYSPCILGVAFCDIPAVEGLYAAQIATYASGSGGTSTASSVRKPQPGTPAAKAGQDPNWRFDPMTGEKLSPQDASGNDGDALMKDVLLDLHNLKDLYAGDPDTESALQQIVDALTSVMQDSSADQQSDDGNGPTGKPQPGNANHSGDSDMALIQFTLGGATVEIDDKHRDGITAIQAAFSAAEKRATDAEAEKATFAARVTELETAAQTAEYAARELAVEAWKKDGKITPAQEPGLKAFAHMQSSDQWVAYAAIMDGAAKIPVATTPGTGAPAGPDGGDDKNALIKNAKQGYRMLITAGVNGDKLKNSKFAKDLVALGVDPEGK